MVGHKQMRKLLPFLACLMLVLTGWTGAACAAENVMCLEVQHVDTAVQMAGNCGEAPADVDKGHLHQHAACHGHHVAAPVESSVAATSIERWTDFASHKAPLWLAHQSDPTLRPPQA